MALINGLYGAGEYKVSGRTEIPLNQVLSAGDIALLTSLGRLEDAKLIDIMRKRQAQGLRGLTASDFDSYPNGHMLP